MKGNVSGNIQFALTTHEHVQGHMRTMLDNRGNHVQMTQGQNVFTVADDMLICYDDDTKLF